jgi:hypothetical protein
MILDHTKIVSIELSQEFCTKYVDYRRSIWLAINKVLKEPNLNYDKFILNELKYDYNQKIYNHINFNKKYEFTKQYNNDFKFDHSYFDHYYKHDRNNYYLAKENNIYDYDSIDDQRKLTINIIKKREEK